MNKHKTAKICGFILILSLTGLTVFAGCKKGTTTAKTETPPIPVQLGKVTQGDITLTLELVGNVLPDKKAILTSNVPGKINKVYRREGEEVPEAEPLVEIDPEEIEIGLQQVRGALAQSYAAAAQARVQRSLAKKEYDRIAKLKEINAVSQSDFDRAKAAYNASQETVRMAEAGVKQAKAVLAKAELYQRDAIVRAPFGGEIARLLVEEGERIQTMPPTPILALVDYSKVKIECPVAERDVGAVTEGMSAQVVFDAYPNVTVEASIGRIVPILDVQSRTFTAQIFLDNPDRLYKPGMMARVYLKASFPNVITVNRDAFSLSNLTGNIRIVEVVDNVARERNAIQGRSFGDRVEIRELAGLKVGSLVIISGASDIVEGQRVTGTLVEETPVQTGEAKVSTSEVKPSTTEVTPSSGGGTTEVTPSQPTTPMEPPPSSESVKPTPEVQPTPMTPATKEAGGK